MSNNFYFCLYPPVLENKTEEGILSKLLGKWSREVSTNDFSFLQILFIYPHEQPFTCPAFGSGHFGQHSWWWRQEACREINSCYSQKLIHFSSLSLYFHQGVCKQPFPPEPNGRTQQFLLQSRNYAIHILIWGLFIRTSCGINFRWCVKFFNLLFPEELLILQEQVSCSGRTLKYRAALLLTRGVDIPGVALLAPELRSESAKLHI